MILRSRHFALAVRLTNFALLGVIAYVAFSTVLFFYEAKPFTPPPLPTGEHPSFCLDEIGDTLAFVPAPAQTKPSELSPAAGLELTGVVVDPGDPERSLAIFADATGSRLVGAHESIRPGVLLMAVDAEGVEIESDGIRSRATLKKSVAPAEAYIAAATPELTATPESPRAPNVTTDNPEGTVVKTVWPPEEKA